MIRTADPPNPAARFLNRPIVPRVRWGFGVPTRGIQNMKNSYSIIVKTAGRTVRAYVSARRLTSAIRLVLESEKCSFRHIRSIERL